MEGPIPKPLELGIGAIAGVSSRRLFPRLCQTLSQWERRGPYVAPRRRGGRLTRPPSSIVIRREWHAAPQRIGMVLEIAFPRTCVATVQFCIHLRGHAFGRVRATPNGL